MTRTFVAIDDAVHRLLRNLAQRTPLKVEAAGANRWEARYEVNAQQVPETYFCLALLHGLGGMEAKRALSAQASFGMRHREQILEQAHYFDVTRLDRRCGRDIRLKTARSGPVMVSAEILCFGTGTLRARNDDPGDRLHRKILEEHGRLTMKRQKVFAVIQALHGRGESPEGALGRDNYESTNVLYGDVLGELEQLWERRAELGFLDGVALGLEQFRRRAVACAGLQPPQNVNGLVGLHLQRQALWRSPPRSGRSLLRRLEFILSNTTVESWPGTEHLPRRAAGPSHPGGQSTFDNSGYDGWLEG